MRFSPYRIEPPGLARRDAISISILVLFFFTFRSSFGGTRARHESSRFTVNGANELSLGIEFHLYDVVPPVTLCLLML